MLGKLVKAFFYMIAFIIAFGVLAAAMALCIIIPAILFLDFLPWSIIVLYVLFVGYQVGKQDKQQGVKENG